MAVITINSEYRTGSQRVASGVSEKLGFAYIGDALVAEIAKELHISKNEADAFRKASQSSLMRYLDRYTCSIVQRVVDRQHGCLDDDTYYNKTRELVEKIYDNENAVILGWGAQCILKSKPETFHVLLKNDDEKKIESLMADQQITRKTAEQMIKTEENDRKAYIKHFFHEDWMDSRLYDVIIDMGKHSVADAVHMICDNAKHHLKSV
ncbi:MAG: AAA family ATPase [Thermodesulfobacteriota bacterium]